jgi:hypothetical protein
MFSPYLISSMDGLSIENYSFDHGCLLPPIFFNMSEIPRPSGCISESVMKIGGTAVVEGITFNA